MKISLITVSNSEIVSNVKANAISSICSSLYKNRQDVLFSQIVKPEANCVKMCLKQAIDCSDTIIVVCDNEWDRFYMCKKIFCELFDTIMVNSEYASKYIDDYAKSQNVPLKKEDYSLCQMPQIARTIKNPFSAFQGCLIEKNSKNIFLLPKENNELYHIFFSSVLPYILNESSSKGKTYILRTFGITLQELSTLLKDEIKNKYNIDVVCSEKYLRGEIVISAKEGTRSDFEKKLVSKVYTKLLPYFYSEKDQSMEEFIFDILSVRHLTISFAEDFTCGNMTSKFFENLTDAHKILHESYITISNESKTKLLGIDKSCLSKSKIDFSEIAYQMALGVLENSGADIVVANCGDLTTGELTFAIGNCEGIHIFNQKLDGSNQEKIDLATGIILFQLIKKLKQDDFHLGQKVV